MNFTKKITAVLTAAFLSVSCFSLTASAISEDELAAADKLLEQEAEAMEEEAGSSDSYITSGDYKYSVRSYYGEDGAYLEEYLGSDTSVVIPDEIDGYPVVGLGDGTFYMNDKITDITIPAQLGDFGYFCFYGCTGITEFKVSEENEIYMADENGAIVGRDGLALMAFPAGNCPETYAIPDGVVALNSSAFAMCSNLKEITIPDSVEFIGNYTFSECTSLDNVVVPEKVTALGNFAFSSCSSLENITLPDGLVSIGNGTFSGCTSLEVFDFPKALTNVGQAAFCNTGFTSIRIPATVSSIDYLAFGFNYIPENAEEERYVPVENFVIMGNTGSYAETYCTENGITFQALDDGTLPTEEVTESEFAQVQADSHVYDEGLSTGQIIAICAGGASGLILLIVIVGVTQKKKKSKGTDDTDKDDSDDDIEVDMKTMSELLEDAENTSETEDKE